MQKTASPEIALEPTDCNCQALRQAARRVTQLYDGYLAPLGLRTQQYSILMKLSRLGPQSINDLSALMVMDRTTTGRAVQPLERDGHIAIEADTDARKRIVKITPSGKALLKQAHAAWQKAQTEFETAYGAPASASLRSALRRAVSALEADDQAR